MAARRLAVIYKLRSRNVAHLLVWCLSLTLSFVPKNDPRSGEAGHHEAALGLEREDFGSGAPRTSFNGRLFLLASAPTNLPRPSRWMKGQLAGDLTRYSRLGQLEGRFSPARMRCWSAKAFFNSAGTRGDNPATH